MRSRTALKRRITFQNRRWAGIQVNRCINGIQVREKEPQHDWRPCQSKLNGKQLVKMLKGLLSVLLVLATLTFTMAKPEKNPAKKEKRVPQTLSRGWGDQLIWAQTYEEGLFWSRSRNKPLMVIFHLEDCPHSQALKKAFAEDKEIQKLVDEEFIVLNLMYETTDKHLSPDGQYVPRILFVDPSMTVRADITGRYSNRMYAYEPSDIKLLLSNMQRALKFLKTEL